MSTGDRTFSWPAHWGGCVAALEGCAALTVAGFATTVEITFPQLDRVYFPLLAMLDDLAHRTRSRVVAGLAAIPGGGKSTFAAALAYVARAVLPQGVFAVVGMDGWHFPNAVLDTRTTLDAAGRVVSLRERKGGPDSYDLTALAEALQSLRAATADVPLPVYDRCVHDPVPGGIVIPAAARVVLVEGNYLLCDDPAWRGVRDLLTPRLFLECDPSSARERIIARHIRGGASPEQALGKFARNDDLNVKHVLAASARADVRIRLQAEPSLAR